MLLFIDCFPGPRFGFITLYVYLIGFFSLEAGLFAVVLSSVYLLNQSFILSFNKYALTAYYVSASCLCTGTIAMNQTKSVFLEETDY